MINLAPHPSQFLMCWALSGQALFMMRVVAQWISQKKSAAWWAEVFLGISAGRRGIFAGLCHFPARPVFILGQVDRPLLYILNILFIWRGALKPRHTPSRVSRPWPTKSEAPPASIKAAQAYPHEELRSAHEALDNCWRLGRKKECLVVRSDARIFF